MLHASGQFNRPSVEPVTPRALPLRREDRCCRKRRVSASVCELVCQSASRARGRAFIVVGEGTDGGLACNRGRRAEVDLLPAELYAETASAARQQADLVTERGVTMQVSFACTEHNLKSRSEDRLCGLRTAPPPGGGAGGGGGGSSQGGNGPLVLAKAREAAASRAPTQGHAHMKEAIGRHSSMKYSHPLPPSLPPPLAVLCAAPAERGSAVIPRFSSFPSDTNLGKSGLRVSCLGLGTWVTFGSQISDEMAESLMTIAYENGINLFDTAEVYASGRAEITLGNIIKKKGWRAETERGLSRKHIIEGTVVFLSLTLLLHPILLLFCTL
ncbi:hypothetical protein JZ751_024396 [Albula glossodonta]|uniref:NADP-dependent oxidoreductase domain-containing protein n=1 Tax=Albula glossodonta TaxID=121402 RepID=A0A8T2NN52_9TELE|nr:hypothetical protein JZ751_024396 [Albula glossodonta]